MSPYVKLSLDAYERDMACMLTENWPVPCHVPISLQPCILVQTSPFRSSRYREGCRRISSITSGRRADVRHARSCFEPQEACRVSPSHSPASPSIPLTHKQTRPPRSRNGRSSFDSETSMAAVMEPCQSSRRQQDLPRYVAHRTFELAPYSRNLVTHIIRGCLTNNQRLLQDYTPRR